MIFSEDTLQGIVAQPEHAALFARVYDELHRLARRERRTVGRDLTLNTTALVHETYLKLREHVDAATTSAQFFALAARAMRQILVDYSRRREARKRGGDFTWTELCDDMPEANRALADVIALDGALDALERIDPDLGALVEFHVFAGLPMTDIAALRGVSTRTAFREWRKARAFLLERISLGPAAV
ncbi:MAG TPA: ECF-type sigma factor [Rhodanobacteraceae bacterium]|nr:ECF-type sigma factor [Rhodanobacteraceae bacterium]